MKSISYSLIAAAAAVGMAHGAETATTKPVGYVTNSLQPGFNLIGLTLQSPSLVTGDIETVNGAQIGDTDLNIQTSLPVGRTYILEVTSGAAAGFVQEFVTVNGGTITLPAAVSGLAADDKYQIRVAPTLEEIFGNTLQTQSTSAGSDIVWLSNGPGVFEKYYRQSPLFGSPVWKKLGPNNTEVNAPNTPVVYLDSFFVEVKTTQKNLVISGELRADVTSLFLGPGFNAVGTVFPVGSNLANSNISGALQSQSTSAGSDIVWISRGPGVFEKYYYQRPLFGAQIWKRLDANNVETTVDANTVNLSTGMFIEKKGTTSSTVKVNPPAYGL